MAVRLYPPTRALEGNVPLPASKSIANRVLIIRALCPNDFAIHNLSEAQDTQTLAALLRKDRTEYDAGPAGTVYRFLTALLPTRSGSFVLTGTERMKQRPIGILVDALRQLGANITYLEKEGFPPLKIEGGNLRGGTITVDGSISSQFISALMMIGPVLPGGLQLNISGESTSQPYIEMTARLMRYFAAAPVRVGTTWSIPETGYRGRALTVESDWSAASYWYAMAALSPRPSNLLLEGLNEKSLQGDVVVQELMRPFGVTSEADQGGIRISRKVEVKQCPIWRHAFMDHPDLAQTMVVVCAGLQVAAGFYGLRTLTIKETDRIQALVTELAAVGITAEATDDSLELGPYAGHATGHPKIATYHDHRMAMAFAPLALVLPGLGIADPEVVSKSYPDFWLHLEDHGFTVNQES